MSSELHMHLQPWSLPWPITGALVLVALVYMRGWLGLRRAFPNVIPARRMAAFMAGLATVWIAVGSPLVTLDHRSLTIHMVKHLLLMAVGPPLILWGTPVPPLLAGMPKWLNFDPLHRSRTFEWIGRRLTHPVVCWLASTATVVGWHVPTMFQLALDHHWLHHVEHASFFAAGVLFWWPVVQPWPSTQSWPKVQPWSRRAAPRANMDRWAVPVYLFLAMLPCDILSGFLVFCGRVVYPAYINSPQLFQFSAIEDQEFAGALMWVAITLIYAIPAAVITVQILSSSAHDYSVRTESV